MHKLLVTGGAGFIGVNFIRHLLESDQNIRIVNLDNLTYQPCCRSLAAIECERHRFVEGDICDRILVDRVLREHKIDTVVHFAAESHVDRSITDPAASVHSNLFGSFTLLEAARCYWLEGSGLDTSTLRFHHVSTDEVFGSLGPRDPPFSETTRYDPKSPYSATKAGADHLVRAYSHTYGLPVTISNCSNNYGPYQLPEKLIPLVVLSAIHGDPIPIYGNGQNIRDWLYVEDHCRAIELILRHGKTGKTYNVGNSNEWRNIDLCRLLCELIDVSFQENQELALRYPRAAAASGGATASTITFVADRPGHDQRYAIDSQMIRWELGFEPEETFETGIRKTIKWYLDHSDWWQPLWSAMRQDRSKTITPRPRPPNRLRS